MTRLIPIFISMVLLMPVYAEAAKPILQITDEPIPVLPDGSARTLDEVSAAIVEGCTVRRWSPVVEGDGKIRATINVRGRHFAEIDISFSTTAYSITYVSSDGLDYNAKKQKIHRNYNNWVIKLSNTINQTLQTMSRAPESTSSQSGNARTGGKGDVYDELLKLDELRERGVLTDDEFEREKRRLLEQD